MSSYKTEGIILKRSNFGEADRILTVYSKNHGKLRLVAKGIRKIKSRKAGSLELFNCVDLYVAKGRNLDLITEAQLVGSFPSWRGNLVRVGMAYYFCEVLDKITPEGQNHPEVFGFLKASLTQLSTGSLKKITWRFQVNLLKSLGFGIPTGSDSILDLQAYIETIAGKKIHTPQIIKKFL